MKSAPALAAGLTHAWVSLYTLGLPAELRTERQAELDSDLWEHAQWRTAQGLRPGRTAFEMVARLIAGMAADLSWRAAARDARRHTTNPRGGGAMSDTMKKQGMMGLAVALGIWAAAVVPMAIGSEESVQVVVSVVFGLLILGGLVLMHRGVRGARLAVAAGAVGTGLMTVWLVLPPIAAIAVVIWLVATRGVRHVPPLPA